MLGDSSSVTLFQRKNRWAPMGRARLDTYTTYDPEPRCRGVRYLSAPCAIDAVALGGGVVAKGFHLRCAAAKTARV
jgi:hypothetical protein